MTSPLLRNYRYILKHLTALKSVSISKLALLSFLLGLALHPRAFGEETESPRLQKEVAQRAIVLQALYSLRFQVNAHLIDDPDVLENMAEEKKRIGVWLNREGLWETLSNAEKNLILSHPGELSQDIFLPLFSLKEDINTLLYTLGYRKLFIPDGAREPKSLITPPIPHCGESTKKFIELAKLRSESDLRSALQMTEIWLYRALLWERVDEKEFPQGDDLTALVSNLKEKMSELQIEMRPITTGEDFFKELIRYTAFLASGQDMAKPPIEDDFPAFGKAYKNLKASEQKSLKQQAQRRLDILRWILNEETTQSTWATPTEQKEKRA